MAASKRNWSPLLAASPSPYVERTRQKVRQAALNESRSSMRNEALLRDVETLEQGMKTFAEETKKLDALKKQYLEYVSSVYPHWVEQAALCREKKRIMGSNASLPAEPTTRTPHPADYRMREQGSRDNGRHTDTLVPPTLPTLPRRAAQMQDPVVGTVEWPPSLPNRSTGQHMLVGSHGEVGGVVHQAPPPDQGCFHPPLAGTEQSSYTTSMLNADKAITASSFVSQVQLPVSAGQNGGDFNTKAAVSQPPAVHQLSSTILTHELSESSGPSSSLSTGEFHHTPSPQSVKETGVSEPPGPNDPQATTQPVPPTGKSDTGSSCSSTPRDVSMTSCKGSTTLSGNLQAQEDAPTPGGLNEPLAAEVEQKTEDKSLLSDEESLSEARQEGERGGLEVASISNSSLADELCGEDSVLPSVTSPPHRHRDNCVEPNLTILDIISPQESDVQAQKPSPLPENVKLELEPYGAVQEQVTADQQSSIKGAGHEQQGSLLVKEEEEEEVLDEDHSGDDSFWDVEPKAVAVHHSLPLPDSDPPAMRETGQSKLPNKDEPPQDGGSHSSKRSVLESAQSSLLGGDSAVRNIEAEVVGGGTDTGGRSKEVPTENAGQVDVDAAGGGSVPTPADGKEEDGSPTAHPIAAAAWVPSIEENSSHSRKEGDGQQRSLSGSLKKKIGFWLDSDSESEIDLSAVTPGGGSGGNDDFDFYT